MRDMEKDEKVYNYNNPRLPSFLERIRYLADSYETDKLNGVSALAKETGISRPTIQYWYNGERTPDAEKLIILAKETGRSIDWLLGLTDKENWTSDEQEKLSSSYTGLSNLAIQNIKNAWSTEALSKLFEAEKLDSLSVIMHDLGVAVSDLRQKIDLFSNVLPQNEDGEKTNFKLRLLKECQERVDYLKYRATVNLRQMVDEMIVMSTEAEAEIIEAKLKENLFLLIEREAGIDGKH